VLETECTALKVNEESMKRSNEMMVKKCADLEKTKEDLMSELENLSVELFSEANALVSRPPHMLRTFH
jgi:prefoldin subunit 5